jgi:hypothetical protein
VRSLFAMNFTGVQPVVLREVSESRDDCKDASTQSLTYLELLGYELCTRVVPCSTPASAPSSPSVDLPSRQASIDTLMLKYMSPTFIDNLARIFAAIASKSPLLLEGPPGVGKTAVIMTAATLTSADIERINMSGSSTLDQLIGSIIPVVFKPNSF